MFPGEQQTRPPRPVDRKLGLCASPPKATESGSPESAPHSNVCGALVSPTSICSLPMPRVGDQLSGSLPGQVSPGRVATGQFLLLDTVHATVVHPVRYSGLRLSHSPFISSSVPGSSLLTGHNCFHARESTNHCPGEQNHMIRTPSMRQEERYLVSPVASDM